MANNIENNDIKISLERYQDKLTLKNKLSRLIWNISYYILFRPFVTKFFRKWRLFVLKVFGAKIHHTSTVFSSTKIWAPWNLEIGAYSIIGAFVDCYNPDKIIIGNHCVVSQKAYLCTASHDITSTKHSLITAPIVIENQSWVAAAAYINMGVTIGEGSVVGATASVYKNVQPWTIVGGNPAKFIKKRIINE